MTECSKLFVCPIWRYRRLSQEPYVTLWKGVNLPGIFDWGKASWTLKEVPRGGNRFQFQPHQNHKVHVGAASTCGSGLSTPNQFMSWKRGLSKPRRWTDCYWSLVNMSTYINLKSLGSRSGLYRVWSPKMTVACDRHYIPRVPQREGWWKALDLRSCVGQMEDTAGSM